MIEDESSSHPLCHSEAGGHLLDLGVPLQAGSAQSACPVAPLQVVFPAHPLHAAWSTPFHLKDGREGAGPSSLHLTWTKPPQLPCSEGSLVGTGGFADWLPLGIPSTHQLLP